MAENRFEGKIGIVTGGGTGFGLACVREIVDGGGQVMIAARREEVIKKAAEELGEQADWVVCDVTSEESVNAAVAATVDRFGGLNLAVNNAGQGGTGSVLNATVDEYLSIVDTNLNGVYRCLRAEAKVMRNGNGGSIVNISSIAGVRTHRWMTPYCVSKAGVNMLTACAADDLGEFDIRVNAIAPGIVPTDIWQGSADDGPVVDEYLALMPISRVGTVEDIGSLVAFLLSDEAGWITGQCIPVDGGHTIRKGPDFAKLTEGLIPVER